MLLTFYSNDYNRRFPYLTRGATAGSRYHLYTDESDSMTTQDCMIVYVIDQRKYCLLHLETTLKMVKRYVRWVLCKGIPLFRDAIEDWQKTRPYNYVIFNEASRMYDSDLFILFSSIPYSSQPYQVTWPRIYLVGNTNHLPPNTRTLPEICELANVVSCRNVSTWIVPENRVRVPYPEREANAQPKL